MVKKYICSECGNVFQSELIESIEEGTQVYCENCGTPFSLEGREFVQREYKQAKKSFPKTFQRADKKRTPREKEKHLTTLKKAISILNDLSYIPILIVSILVFVGLVEIAFKPGSWAFILIRQIAFGTAGLIISLYDKRVIKEKVENEDYDNAFLASFCLGILGCIIYGSGVIILIKGVFMLVYVFYGKESREITIYNTASLLKNSFLKFSTKFGFIIVILGIHGVFNFSDPSYKDMIRDIMRDFPGINPFIIIAPTFITLFVLSVISLLIHYKVKDKLLYNPDIDIVDFIKVLILGILGTIFFAAGIFIILEACTLFITFISKPKTGEGEFTKREVSEPAINPYKRSTTQSQVRERRKEPVSIEQRVKIREEINQIEDEETKDTEKKEEQPGIKETTPITSTDMREEVQESKQEKEKREKKKPEEKMEEYKLKLHESLLPVKDKKDKKLVKKYFSKIFSILSKDIKEKVDDLNLSRKEKKEVLKELTFLSREKQVEYIDALVNLYHEQIPKSLVERIRHLPNVKPEHYQELVNELKYLDRDEQLRFINYLEKYA